MPRKVRALIADLQRAGFLLERTRGSHRQFAHPDRDEPITVSGNLGHDAKRYQEKQVAEAIREATS